MQNYDYTEDPEYRAWKGLPPLKEVVCEIVLTPSEVAKKFSDELTKVFSGVKAVKTLDKK